MVSNKWFVLLCYKHWTWNIDSKWWSICHSLAIYFILISMQIFNWKRSTIHLFGIWFVFFIRMMKCPMTIDSQLETKSIHHLFGSRYFARTNKLFQIAIYITCLYISVVVWCCPIKIEWIFDFLNWSADIRYITKWTYNNAFLLLIAK